ncbi:transmembrane protein 81 [Passer domesticus]|uniref:transmembrane protein 81 n=1 Tax=Passer domesticus TaxID=48849 RepID=UPI0030FE9C2C
MEQSPIVVILLCALCIPAMLLLGSGMELPLGSGMELPLGLGSELPSGAGSELPLEPGLELPLGPGSKLPLEPGSELSSEPGLESGLSLDPGSELPSGVRSGSELPSEPGLELPSGARSGSELPSEPGLELPSGARSGSELPSEPGSELSSEPESELPSEPGSELSSEPESELPSEARSRSELPSELGSGFTLPPGAGSMPLGLKPMVAVNSTPCSVTCGLGLKQEQLCEVSPAGERRNCSLVRSRCLTDWICGLQHFSIPEGKPFKLICLSPEAASLEGPNFGYTWRFARGLITTNDLLFHPFRNPSPSLSFSPALESHSGTYRCDVQVLSSFQLVKRIYFGLRVIPKALVDLDFEKSLTWEQQQLASGEEPPGNATGAPEHRESFWKKQWFYEAVLGIGSGVIMGILFSVGLCCLGRVCRKRAAREMNED